MWYYRTLDEKEIYAFRSSYLEKYSYVYVSGKEMTAEALKALFPAIEGVSEPKGLVKSHTGESGKIWYYRTFDKENNVYAFRFDGAETYSYALVSDVELPADELKALFPAIEGVSAPDGREFYSKLYTSEDGKRFSYLIPYAEAGYEFYSKLYSDGKKTAYLVPYEEPQAEFYYSAYVPDDYDVVRLDSEYRTIDEIKALVQSVYSRDYALSLESSLFDGVASGDAVMKARYAVLDVSGAGTLCALNSYESLFSEQRVYLFDTAKIVKKGSNKKSVRVSVQTYLPSDPDKIVVVEIGLVLQDGQWFLDSPTF